MLALRFFLVSLVLIFLVNINSSDLAFAGFPQEPTVPDMTRPRPESFKKVALIEFKGEIDQKLTLYFQNRFEKAKAAGVDLLIIEVDSPGGLKIQSLEMARQIRDCKAYTVALIGNEAISGGALVTLGTDEIFINPNAKFGDIGEIGFDMEQFAWRLIEPKIESVLYRDARDLAESKGRSPELAESLVDKDVLVYSKPREEAKDEADKGGDEAKEKAAPKLEFKLVRADAANQPGPPWQLIPETGPERFLTLSGQRARELGLAQHFAINRAELAKQLKIEESQVIVYKYTTTDTIVYHLNKPWVTGLLVLIGLISLYVEINAPGIGAGGLIAGLCAMLFFWSRFLAGTSGWLEVLLFLAGVIFILMEIFVIPGFGVSGLTGLILLFFSVVLASQNFTIPQTAAQWNQSLTATFTLMISGLVFIVAAALISRRLGSIPIFSQLVLDTGARGMGSDATADKDADGKPIPPAHPSVSVGDWGVAESLLRPAGRVKFAGRSFDVISDGSFVESGTQVTVIRINGNVITVAPVEEKDDGTGR